MSFQIFNLSSFILFIILFILSILDYCLTDIGLKTGEIFELNPIMNYIFENCSFWGGLLIKQSLISLMSVPIFTIKNYNLFLWVSIILYLGVVFINLRNLHLIGIL